MKTKGPKTKTSKWWKEGSFDMQHNFQKETPPPAVSVPRCAPTTTNPLSSWQKFMTDLSPPPTGEPVLTIFLICNSPVRKRQLQRPIGWQNHLCCLGKTGPVQEIMFCRKRNCKKKQVRIVGGFSFTVTIARSSQYHSLGKEQEWSVITHKISGQ